MVASLPYIIKRLTKVFVCLRYIYFLFSGYRRINSKRYTVHVHKVREIFKTRKTKTKFTYNYVSIISFILFFIKFKTGESVSVVNFHSCCFYGKLYHYHCVSGKYYYGDCPVAYFAVATVSIINFAIVIVSIINLAMITVSIINFAMATVSMVNLAMPFFCELPRLSSCFYFKLGHIYCFYGNLFALVTVAVSRILKDAQVSPDF